MRWHRPNGKRRRSEYKGQMRAKLHSARILHIWKEGERMARPYKELTAASIPAKQYFTVAEVAELTGSHIHTIQRRLREGKLQGKKLGGEWKIYAESVNEEVGADFNNQKGR